MVEGLTGHCSMHLFILIVATRLIPSLPGCSFIIPARSQENGGFASVFSKTIVFNLMLLDDSHHLTDADTLNVISSKNLSSFLYKLSLNNLFGKL